MQDLVLDDLRVLLQREYREIFADSSRAPLVRFDQSAMCRTAAERLDRNGSRARIEIQKACALDAGRQDVENGLPQAVRGRTHIHSGGSNETTRAQASGDDAHGWSLAG